MSREGDWGYRKNILVLGTGKGSQTALKHPLGEGRIRRVVVWKEKERSDQVQGGRNLVKQVCSLQKEIYQRIKYVHFFHMTYILHFFFSWLCFSTFPNWQQAEIRNSHISAAFRSQGVSVKPLPKSLFTHRISSWLLLSLTLLCKCHKSVHEKVPILLNTQVLKWNLFYSVICH